MLFTTVFALSTAVLASAVPTATYANAPRHTPGPTVYKMVLKVDSDVEALKQFNGENIFFQKDGFFQNQYDLSFSKTKSDTLKIVGNKPLFTSGNGIHLGGLGFESQAGSISFSKSSSDAKIVVGQHGAVKYLKDNQANFGHWLACVSQYGASLGWATKKYNVTEANQNSSPVDKCAIVDVLLVKV